MLTIKLPNTLFHRLEGVAELSHRSVDEVLVSTLNATLVAPPDLPANLANELAAMHILNDAALWAAVRPSFTPAEPRRLEQLNDKAHEKPLTQAEGAEQTTLLDAYYRSVLRRAQALAVLAQRGYPISPEVLSPVTLNNDISNSHNATQSMDKQNPPVMRYDLQGTDTRLGSSTRAALVYRDVNIAVLNEGEPRKRHYL